MAKGKEYMPAVAMVAVQAGYAGLNVLTKLALDTGMSPYVLIAYRQIIATIVLAPIAFFLERKTRIMITRKILLQILICSIFGATINQLLYFIGLKYTTSTMACALTNILPAMTFIMAIPFRIETAEMKSSSGKAKIVGTALCVGGSMLMTFYKGALINLPSSSFHWRYAVEVVERATKASESAAAGSSANEILGAMLVVGSCVAWAVWFIMQAKMSKSFSAPYTTSTLMCAMACVECLLIGGVVERDLKRWALGFDIRLASVLYIGLVGSGFAVLLIVWAIEKRGPLFVSMFSPLLLVIVAVLGWAILDERLYIGSALGSVIIVVGLYLVLWGKGREFKVEASDKRAIKSKEPGEGEGEEGEEGEKIIKDIKVDISIYSLTTNANCEKQEVQIEEV